MNREQKIARKQERETRNEKATILADHKKKFEALKAARIEEKLKAAAAKKIADVAAKRAVKHAKGLAHYLRMMAKNK